MAWSLNSSLTDSPGHGFIVRHPNPAYATEPPCLLEILTSRTKDPTWMSVYSWQRNFAHIFLKQQDLLPMHHTSNASHCSGKPTASHHNCPAVYTSDIFSSIRLAELPLCGTFRVNSLRWWESGAQRGGSLAQVTQVTYNLPKLEQKLKNHLI